MLYYHAFPQPNPKRDREVTNRVGLRTLESILSYGILLTPEPLSVPRNPKSELSRPPSTFIEQRRACFTAVDRSDLLREDGHTTTFGQFSLGLEPADARRLGAVPVFYYHQAGLSLEVLFRLAEIRRLLIAVANIEAGSDPNGTQYPTRKKLKSWGLVLVDEPGVAELVENVCKEKADELLAFLATDRVAAANLAEWIEVTLSMFQKTEPSDGEILKYYKQREFRIVQVYSSEVWCLPLDLARGNGLSKKAEAYIEACKAHLSEFKDEFKLRLDIGRCYVVAGTCDRKFRDFVREIICPPECVDGVRRLLGRLKIGKGWTETFDSGFGVLIRSGN